MQALEVLPVAHRLDCKFYVVRYVPNLVREEFVNIGVILHTVSSGKDAGSSDTDQATFYSRFTTEWTRVLALDPSADIDFLSRLTTDLHKRLSGELKKSSDQRLLLDTLLADFSNCIQISDAKFSTAISLPSELSRLMKLYVDPLKDTEADFTSPV